ncbi:hypothetical protein E2C01_044373 [Portunus trituberculatus]|uniref:Uncharacterized protein n=1 Tax=Portunus trituberculatus TaxID=210409 RepID=A0A5B7G248_PORTR|nr:hypothetical protein [Portunus trituberculatus]
MCISFSLRTGAPHQPSAGPPATQLRSFLRPEQRSPPNIARSPPHPCCLLPDGGSSASLALSFPRRSTLLVNAEISAET